MKKKINKIKKIEEIIKKRMTPKITYIENFDDNSENGNQQQNQDNYPPNIQGLFERLGIE